MAWVRDRVWQLAIAVLLALVGASLVYLGGAGDAELSPLGIVGLLLFALGLAIPLARKVVSAVQEDEADEEA